MGRSRKSKTRGKKTAGSRAVLKTLWPQPAIKQKKG
jgi:hypothetical protein